MFPRGRERASQEMAEEAREESWLTFLSLDLFFLLAFTIEISMRIFVMFVAT